MVGFVSTLQWRIQICSPYIFENNWLYHLTNYYIKETPNIQFESDLIKKKKIVEISSYFGDSLNLYCPFISEIIDFIFVFGVKNII